MTSDIRSPTSDLRHPKAGRRICLNCDVEQADDGTWTLILTVREVPTEGNVRSIGFFLKDLINENMDSMRRLAFSDPGSGTGTGEFADVAAGSDDLGSPKT